MAKNKKTTVKNIGRLRQFFDKISDACGCVKNGKASPKCKVCDGTGKVKIRPLK